MSTTPPSLIARYEARNIADEAGLFYNLQPEKSLCFKGKSCQGSHKRKQRVAVLFPCDANGSEKMKLIVIGRYQNPHRFKLASRVACLVRTRLTRKPGWHRRCSWRTWTARRQDRTRGSCYSWISDAAEGEVGFPSRQHKPFAAIRYWHHTECQELL